VHLLTYEGAVCSCIRCMGMNELNRLPTLECTAKQGAHYCRAGRCEGGGGGLPALVHGLELTRTAAVASRVAWADTCDAAACTLDTGLVLLLSGRNPPAALEAGVALLVRAAGATLSHSATAATDKGPLLPCGREVERRTAARDRNSATAKEGRLSAAAA
jgi:hypothetical protein